MNIITLFQGLNVAVVAAFLASTGIPALSALISKAHWDSSITGFITLGLSSADGVLSEWAKDGAGFHWKAAVGTAALSYAVAALIQSRVLSGTQFESWLLSIGSNLGIGTDPTDGIPYDEPVAATVHVHQAAALTAADPEQPPAGVPPPDGAPIAGAHAVPEPVVPAIPLTPTPGV